MKQLVLSGSPRERGLLHGQSFAREIHEFIEIRKTLLFESFKSWPQTKIDQLVDAHLKVLRNDGELWEEFSAIAEAAKVSTRDLMILNNHTDLRDFVAGDFDETFNECSCFAFKKGKHIVAGQTWDMHGSAKPYVVQLTIKKGSQTQEIFSLTGCLGLTGVTNNAFGVFINNLRSRELSLGYAWPAVVRKLLDCQTLAEATKKLREFMPSAGRNFLLVDSNDASCFEVTGKQIAQTGNLNSGYLFHTNHYLTELKKTEDESARSKTTLDRYAFLSNKAPQVAAGELNIEKISEDIFNSSVGILSLPLSKENPHASATCGGLIYDFQSKKGTSFEGLYSEQNHIHFKL